MGRKVSGHHSSICGGTGNLSGPAGGRECEPEKDPGSGIWSIFCRGRYQSSFRDSVVDDLRPERGNPFLGIFSSYPAGSLYRDPLGSLFLHSLPEKTDLETGALCLRAAGRLAAAGKRNQQQKRLFPDRKGRFLGKGTVLY